MAPRAIAARLRTLLKSSGTQPGAERLQSGAGAGKVPSEICHDPDYDPAMADSTPNSTDSDESGSLLGRLLVVPLIIIGVILTCAVIVVLAFGAIASEKEKPISQVLAVLEAGTGKRTAGLILIPQDKEMWQAAQELALRLNNADIEIDPD